MKYSTLSQLRHTEFDIRNITVHLRHFEDQFIHDYSTKARSKNLLHLVTSGSRRYEIGEREFILPANTVLFIPDNTYYLTQAISTGGCDCQGIGIRFDLCSLSGENIILEPDIYHNWNNSQNQYIRFFHNLCDCFESPDFSILWAKSLLYRLLYNLTANMTDAAPSYTIIEPAIRFIGSHYRENHPIKVYADQCQISESYFRKKFVECMGIPPIEYRNRLRFREARRLYQENHSIQEISEMVGFCDANYFTKLYKRSMGVSLKNDPEIV